MIPHTAGPMRNSYPLVTDEIVIRTFQCSAINARKTRNEKYPRLWSLSRGRLPPAEPGIVKHVGIVPTLALTTKLTCSGIALVLHPCLQDTRVRKIN